MRSTCLPFALVPLMACGGTVAASHESVPSDASADAQTPPFDAQPGDAFVSEAAADTGPGPACECEPGQVYRLHECIATTQLGCGPGCDPATGCGDKHECSACAASSSCGVHDCRPACIFTGPSTGPVAAGALRIFPTVGTAGASTPVTVSGYPFYIGALSYGVRFGDLELWEGGGAGPCSFYVSSPASDPGMVPVFVSQYGPSEPWVVAGFFTYSGGVIPECIQPGFPCLQSEECCATAAAPMHCTQGRCMQP